MGPKMGAGFSRVLSKLDRPEILDMILSKKDTIDSNRFKDD
jgi:hypothetical protein